MLRELHIAGLGVIDDVDLRFDPGLNVLTGETGAGKTMVTVGLALLLGRRASTSLVRSGAGAATIGARFDVASPSAAPVSATWLDDPRPGGDDEGLVLSRSIGAGGKGSVRIAGQLATVGALAEIGPELVEIHGQHDAQRLLRSDAQAEFLDRYAGAAHLRTLEAYRERVRSVAALRARIEELTRAARDREREIDLLAYQVREIDDVGPQPGELDRLAGTESRLAHAERLLELAAAAVAGLTGEAGSSDGVRAAAAALDEAASLDDGSGEAARRAAGLVAEVEELARDVRAHAESLAVDPDALEELRARIGSLRDLRRKYGDDETAVLAYRDDAERRLSAVRGADDERRELSEQLGEAGDELAGLAAEVSGTRAIEAPALAAAIEEEVRDLGMQGARVEIDLRPADGYPLAGPERVEVRLSGGPGQHPVPLTAAASGGELSRVMLACRSVLADLDQVPTLVFDEVDAGIGGEAGIAVGRRLARIAATRQVLVVTHLPQIAAFADRQFTVTKRDGTARVALLDPEARIAELSRMLSGLPGSDSAAVHAEELLAEAGRARDAAR